MMTWALIMASKLSGGLSEKPSHNKDMQSLVDGVQTLPKHVATVIGILGFAVGMWFVWLGLIKLRDKETATAGVLLLIAGALVGSVGLVMATVTFFTANSLMV